VERSTIGAMVKFPMPFPDFPPVQSSTSLIYNNDSQEAPSETQIRKIAASCDKKKPRKINGAVIR
jgi:hypothetical protein